MDVLTFETWCVVNSEIIKQLASRLSVFIQLGIAYLCSLITNEARDARTIKPWITIQKVHWS
jgi:hypothetical protein